VYRGRRAAGNEKAGCALKALVAGAKALPSGKRKPRARAL
jgi:hypothetical protein